MNKSIPTIYSFIVDYFAKIQIKNQRNDTIVDNEKAVLPVYL